MIYKPMVFLPAIILAVSGLISSWFLVGILTRWRCDRRLRASVTGRGILALTYDDGPGNRTTPELLDLLNKHATGATFFLIGDSAEEDPEIVSRLKDEGHTVGWHTRTHHNQWKTGPIRGLADLVPSAGLLGDGVGSIRLFRPPYGKMTLGTVATCLVRGWRIITWTHVSGDTHRELPSTESFIREVDRAGGGVVLMHDMDREDPTRAAFVLAVTEGLIDLAKRRDWRIVHSLEDWGRIA